MSAKYPRTIEGKRRAAITALRNLVDVLTSEPPTDEDLDRIDTMACRYHMRWCQYEFGKRDNPTATYNGH
jgi:hypothetical protein